MGLLTHLSNKGQIIRQNRMIVAGLSLLIGGLLSGFLLRFLFGTRIYTQRGWNLLAPSSMIPAVGRVGIVNRLTSTAIDTIIFGAIAYVLIYAVVWIFDHSTGVRRGG